MNYTNIALGLVITIFPISLFSAVQDSFKKKYGLPFLVLWLLNYLFFLSLALGVMMIYLGICLVLRGFGAI